jgi:monofunctional biosynthetic peptidoglycan transglycosylase
VRLKWRRARWARAILGLAGVAFGYLAYVYLTLPDVRVLATSTPKTTAFMQLRKDEARAAGRRTFAVRQQWVPYGRISTHLKRAVLVAEDSAFYQHDGLDYGQIRESIEFNLEEGRMARGASTITQQLAKNLYLSPSRNPVRKYKELIITRRLEAALSKRRILELYLNVIEWGDGIFGCEAAARAYFGKSAASLSVDEAALLAAAIINPRLYSPAHPNARLRRRQQLIGRRMGAVAPPPESSAPAAAGPQVTAPDPPKPEANQQSHPARPVQSHAATGE